MPKDSNSTGRGGWRNGGRPTIEGKERRWIIPQDILDIIAEKGKAYIWEAIRFKFKLDQNYTVMTNFFNELKARHNNAYFGESPICQAMYLHEVFDYNLFEEIRFSPLIGNKPEAFTIHKQDIEEGGKFYDFRNYSLMKMSREFSCSVSLS